MASVLDADVQTSRLPTWGAFERPRWERPAPGARVRGASSPIWASLCARHAQPKRARPQKGRRSRWQRLRVVMAATHCVRCQ